MIPPKVHLLDITGPAHIFYEASCHGAPVSLDDLAATGNVHPVTVSRSFPRYFGCTLGEYMRKLKIERSLAIIRSHKASLTSVVYSCGFFDQCRFTRVFSHLNGVLPSVWTFLSL